MPVGDGLTHKLTDLRSWLLNCRTAERLTGRSTVLTWTAYQFQTNLNDSDFTQTGLRRAR